MSTTDTNLSTHEFLGLFSLRKLLTSFRISSWWLIFILKAFVHEYYAEWTMWLKLKSLIKYILIFCRIFYLQSISLRISRVECWSSSGVYILHFILFLEKVRTIFVWKTDSFVIHDDKTLSLLLSSLMISNSHNF